MSFGPTRRSVLAGLGALALAGPGRRLIRPGLARADEVAKRAIFFYFPDGVPGPSQNGDPSKWHCTGGETDFALSEVLEGLAPWRDRCVFLNGLSMGGTDEGSHPGGAKKLLTAADGGGGESIDQLLSRTAGGDSYWRHLYLGVQANHNNASGDKHIVYPTAGQSIAPEDDPRRAFELLFGATPPNPGGGEDPAPAEPDPVRVSVIDGVLDEMTRRRARRGGVAATTPDLHLLPGRVGELRTTTPPGSGGGGGSSAGCGTPSIDTGGFGTGSLYDPAAFGEILRAQTDLMVLAMACGLTRVGTLQASHHTSELVMSRIPGSAMFDPGYDMRSHQASHYGASHDPGSREYSAFVQQRQWFVAQFAYLLDRLDALPDGDGTMLDSSLLVLCTEVCDGNTHLHGNMPFVLAGGAGGRLSGGRLLDYGGRRHGDLWVSVAQAMGEPVTWFGDSSQGALPGLIG